jgi:knotted carbamoyltransferase YgeW
MADALHVINQFGGVENLKGKKIAMTWAYSPSYGKPLSVPQGIIGLFTRFGMDVVLAHPEGYNVMPEIEEIAKKNAEKSGGSYTRVNSMAEAFKDADIVYPKSWAPFAVMEERTALVGEGKFDELKSLEKRCLENNARFKDWECTEKLMASTKNGKALYMHGPPADITGVSCKQGECAATVFDRYRQPLYKQASFKPYIIAAMIFLSKFSNPAAKLTELLEAGTKRIK